MLTRTVIASETKQSLYSGGLLHSVRNDVFSRVVFLMLFFFFFLSHAELVSASLKSNISINPGDSAKNKYDINDPRNPHCPCHQYQKLANEEYARLQGNRRDRTINFVQGELKSVAENSGRRIGSINSFWFYHKKRKISGKNKKGYKKMKYKISDKLSRCFHF